MKTVKQYLAGLKRAAMRRPQLEPPFKLIGGPYHGQALRLVNETGDYNTLTFTANGETGRYVGSHWRPVTL